VRELGVDQRDRRGAPVATADRPDDDTHDRSACGAGAARVNGFRKDSFSSKHDRYLLSRIFDHFGYGERGIIERSDLRLRRTARTMPDLSEPRGGFWGELTAQERGALLAAGSWVAFQAGTPLFLQGDAAEHLIVIWAGYAKVLSRNGAGHQVLLAFRGPGDLVGEIAGVDGGQRSASVEAIQPVRALLLEAGAFRVFLDRSSHASSVLRRVLGERLREADRKRLASASMAVGQRLAGLLLELADRFGTVERAGTRISLALSQEDLAACVGASRRAVAREIEGWRDRGIVLTGRRNLLLRQPTALRRIAGIKPEDNNNQSA
jgi:CRP-like cAMP-binding protein